MGLRSRLLALIALALLPAFGLMYFISHIEHDAVRAEAERYALTLTQKEAVNQLKTIYEARTALSILARIPEIAQSADVCTGFLRRYIDQAPHLANIGIIQSDGHLLCSSVPLYGHDPDISTLPYFRQRVPRPRFILSDRIIAPLNGRRTLVATYPVLDTQGTARRILFATLPLDWFSTAASHAQLPTGAFFSLLDANGHVLAHYPDSTRLIPHEQILLHNIQPHTRTATPWAGRTQIDGHEWAVTVTGLNTHALGHGLHVIVAIPMTSPLQDADSRLYWNFGVLSTFALITLILAWYGGNLLILRPIQRLAKAADMIASGRYSVRTHILAGPREITALGDAFDNMAGALEERMRQDEIQKQRITRLNRIYHILSAINGAIIRIRDRDQLLNEACRIVVELGHLQFAWIGLIEPDRDALRIAALAGNAEAFVRTIRVTLDPGQPEGQGLVGEAIRAGECKFSNQVSEDPRLNKWREGLDDAGIQSAAAFPLKVHGLTVGALALYTSEPDFFDEQELTLLNELAADTALGLEHIEKDQQISFLANRDTLTRLPNRNLFEDRLRQELRRFHHNTVQMAVLAISVVNYPRINDSKGRAIGDQVLLAVAARLEALDLSDESQGLLKDRVARLGNHDFCLIVGDAADPAYIEALSEKIHATLAESVKTEREAVDLDVRIGAALYPRDARQVDDLIHHALFATHIQTAVSPHSRIAFYSAQEDTAAQNRDALEAGLRTAVERQEFYLEYQPRVNAKTGTISSAEALIQKWTREIGQPAKCSLGLCRQSGGGFVVHAVGGAPVQ
ncbi:hypothetical protein BI364_16390 [Acidihalobacter yilgarnensis]|uniref:Diguanylate cyclase n=1 Tax=Acidihalobacter yilgarnensis TaxID=2819280 RepID=A0A1D8ISB7_9GAMM|nr:diguanylate cyclase [Acidihalobacter yilgarnensis]AOU99297.1 hypothetical protein BI364_16390 [Acidihalobacter yilgarnensis]